MKQTILKLKYFAVFVVTLLLASLLYVTCSIDRPWWGLVENPTFKFFHGKSSVTILREYFNTSGNLQWFYEKYHRFPKSFQEMDDMYIKSKKSSGDNPNRVGEIGVFPQHIISKSGYNSKDYRVKYRDGSTCLFILKPPGFNMKCTYRNYWLGGRLMENEYGFPKKSSKE